MLLPGDKKAHPDCLNCHVCGVGCVGKQFAISEEGIVCVNCHIAQVAPPCMGCNQKITDSFLNVLDGKWHAQCFRCAMCQTDLTVVPFFPYNGRPYCQQHYLQSSSAPCDRCAQPIVGAYYAAFEKRWHQACFYCEEGKHPIAEATQYHLSLIHI